MSPKNQGHHVCTLSRPSILAQVLHVYCAAATGAASQFIASRTIKQRRATAVSALMPPNQSSHLQGRPEKSGRFHQILKAAKLVCFPPVNDSCCA